MRYGEEYIVSSHGFCSIYAIDKNGKLKWTLNVGFPPSSNIVLLTMIVAGTNRRGF
jgi:outer membrane protein assembly factor BamB